MTTMGTRIKAPSRAISLPVIPTLCAFQFFDETASAGWSSVIGLCAKLAMASVEKTSLSGR
ncbi:hypothetical protein D3C86_1828360 [compost metagenome]